MAARQVSVQGAEFWKYTKRFSRCFNFKNFSIIYESLLKIEHIILPKTNMMIPYLFLNIIFSLHNCSISPLNRNMFTRLVEAICFLYFLFMCWLTLHYCWRTSCLWVFYFWPLSGVPVHLNPDISTLFLGGESDSIIWIFFLK